MRFITKKRVAAAAAAAVIAGGGMAAYAYFTGGATSSSGQAHTGSSVSWSVGALSFSGGTMYPGSGTDSASFTITNNGNGDQALTAVTASVNAGTGGAVTENGTAHAGCLAIWYSASVSGLSPAVGTSIVKTGTATGTVSVSLTESNSDQNPCKGVQPDVTLNVA